MTGAIVDAHVHLWDADAFELPWWRPQLGLPRRRDAADLLAAQEGCDVVGHVVVQAAHTRRERDWLATQSALLPAAALVAQHDPAGEDPGLETEPLAGIRLSLRASEPDWRGMPGLAAVLDGARREGRVVELLCRSDQLECAASVAGAHPDVVFVLDHLGLGAEQPDAEWARGVAALAAHANTMAKLSGLFVPGEGEERARRAAQVAWDRFTPDRVMFGSDWPMSARGMTYREVVERTEALLAPLGEGERRAVRGENARRTYCELIDNR